jgi:hypothetical protein
MTEQAHEPGPDGMKRRGLTKTTVERSRRPACRGVKLRKYRSLTDQGDGSAPRWVRCPCGGVARSAGRSGAGGAAGVAAVGETLLL